MAGRSDIEAGRAFVRLFLKDDLTKALAGTLKSAGDSIKAAGVTAMKTGAGMTAAGLAIVTPIVGAVKHFAGFGDQLDKMSLRTGVAAPALAELGFAAEQSGADIGTVEMGVRLMQRRLVDLAQGSKEAADSFAILGLSATDLQGLRPEDQFQLIADRIAAIEDPTKRAGAALEIFGRSGTMLVPMLSDLKALRQEARDLGIVPSDEEVKNAAKVTDAINRVRRTVGAMIFDIGASLAEPALRWLESAKQIGVSIGRWVKDNAELVRTVGLIGAGLVVAGGAVTAFGAVLWVAGAALGKLGGVIMSVTGIAGRIGGVLAAPFRLLGTAASRAAGVVKSAISTAATLATASLRGMAAGAVALGTVTAAAARAGAAIGRNIGAGVSTAIASFRSLRANGMSLGPAIGLSLYRGISRTVSPITSAMAGAFARIRGMAATTGGFLRRSFSLSGAGAGIGRGLGGLAGAAGMLGAIGIGGAFAPLLAGAPILLGVLGSIGTALGAVLTPVGLLTAAVVAGGAAWLKFSDSGRAAWAGLRDAILPIFETLKGTFAGVKDALMAGEFRLAGGIAMAGLKLAVLQGLGSLEESFGGTFANIIRYIGKAGDGLVKAWSKVTDWLRKQWNNWGADTLDTVIEVVGLIPDIWQRAVEQIANIFLDLGNQSSSLRKTLAVALGPVGEFLLDKAAKAAGFDTTQQQEQAEAMEDLRRPLLQRQLRGSISMAKKGLAGTATEEELRSMNITPDMKPEEKKARLEAAIEQWTKELEATFRAAGDKDIDVLSEARAGIKDYVTKLRSDLSKAGSEAGTGEVSKALEGFLEKIRSGASEAEAKAEYDRLQAEAAKVKQQQAAAGAEAGKPAAVIPGEGEAAGLPTTTGKAAPTNLITFSAAAAQAAGQGAAAGGPQERMAQNLFDMRKTLESVGLLQRDMTASNQYVATLFERYLAAFTYA